jgi:hypothetical protein
MKQEDKELVLKYLSMALPYDLQVKTDEDNEPYFLLSVKPYKGIALILIGVNMDGEDIISKVKIDTIKPYLRPLSSMTLEEIEEFRHFKDYLRESECKIHIANYNQIQWLLEKHFDFMGLIPINLAIKVSKENDPYNITEE